jgi:glycosyltransferase involved in cell wall biosynthesis
VVGDGGTLVSDGDTAAMADAVRRLLADSVAWEEASRRALARAACFDWSVTAAIHADVYRSVAG